MTPFIIEGAFLVLKLRSIIWLDLPSFERVRSFSMLGYAAAFRVSFLNLYSLNSLFLYSSSKKLTCMLPARSLAAPPKR